MSNLAVGLTWDRSRAKGSNLLVLLAIADGASDRGLGFWGSNEHLGDKSRLSPRSLRYILAKLKRDGETVVRPNLNRIQPEGSKGYIPDRFIDVRCVSEWATYQTEGGKLCRKPRKPSVAKIALVSTSDGQAGDEKLPRSKRKDLLVDLSVEVKAAPLPRRYPQTPELATMQQLQVLVDEALEFGTFETQADLSDAVKTRASRLMFVYEPEVLARAIDKVTLLRGFDQSTSRRAIQ